jgi:FAD/FMN-containing dehydrogenase
MTQPADLSPLKALLGPSGWSTDPERLAPKLVEWRERWHGHTPLLLLPRTTAEVAAIIGWCAAHGVAVTPQGGNTGLVGGQIPEGEVLLSLEKLDAVREVSPLDDVMIIEAGASLVTAQETAAAHGRFFPLSLASEGSATLGGLISTNAGGTAVLRYGTMRDLVLGIEAVLPNGQVFQGLRRLRKDNTGYDLKQLLIGAEGTLGVVTAAALKLFPALKSRNAAFVAVASPKAALDLLALAKADSGGGVEAFELMSAPGVGFAERYIPGCRNPLTGDYPWYVLIELAGAEDGQAERALQRILETGLESTLILDAAIAQSEAQSHDFWRIRESQSAAQKAEGSAWKHDVSVPVARVPDFMATATAAVEAYSPGARVVAFGHVGDGNIHYDVLPPVGGDPAAHSALRDGGARIVHDIVASLGGSISAEHGLGTMKTQEALRYKDPVAVVAMRAVRLALDPGRIMNPRVLF